MIKKIRSVFARKYKESIPEILSPTLINVRLLETYSIRCSCGSLAVPIGERGVSYQCIRCGKQPSEGPKYNLGQRTLTNQLNLAPKKDSQILHIDFYEDAIDIMKQKNYR